LSEQNSQKLFAKFSNCLSDIIKIPKIFNQKFPRFSIKNSQDFQFFGVKYLLLFRYFSIIDSFYSIVLKIGINHVIALVAWLVEEP